MNFALNTRNFLSTSHKNEEFCIENDYFCRKESSRAGCTRAIARRVFVLFDSVLFCHNLLSYIVLCILFILFTLLNCTV